MNRIYRLFSMFLVVLALAAASGGCVSAYRAHPELDARIKGIKTIGIFPADIRIYELTAGDVEELRDDWSLQGRENVMKAAPELLRKNKAQTKIIGTQKGTEDEIEDVQALYRTVSYTILQYTYGEYPLPQKHKNFDYTVGPIKKLLDPHGVDAVLLLHGFDEISSGGRKALRALSMVTGLLTGVQMRAGVTGISAALVDKNGTVLWYNIKTDEGGYDLRNPGSARGMLKSILSDFPEATP